MTELTLAQRREMREQQIKSESIDPASKCQCERCGQIHYRKREVDPTKDIGGNGTFPVEAKIK